MNIANNYVGILFKKVSQFIFVYPGFSEIVAYELNNKQGMIYIYISFTNVLFGRHIADNYVQILVSTKKKVQCVNYLVSDHIQG